MSARASTFFALAWLSNGCAPDFSELTAGHGGDAASSLGGAGAGGSSNADSGVGGSAATGGDGNGGAPPVTDCPDDGQDTAQLTLVGLGIPNPVPTSPVDAGVSSGDAGVDSGVPDASAQPSLDASTAPAILLPGLEGWAAVAGRGTTSTIGGAAGRVVTAHTDAELEAYAQSAEPLVIRLCGTLSSPALQVSSNKTLVGVGDNPTLEGGLSIRGTPDAFVHDVIVKNLRIDAASTNADGAGIQIYDAHHVWIDHSELFDAPNGLIQVVHGSDFVSISWTKFHFTPATPDVEHRFACLIGDSDAAQAEDGGHLNVTLHHNWWADYIRQRAPRVRFGDVHLFDNYYSSAGNDWSIWAAVGSHVLLENNDFHGVNSPHELHDPDAQLLATGNIYDGATGSMQSTGSAFTPPYAYTLDDATSVRDGVTQGAGTH